MKSVRVRVPELLEVLMKNRDTHVAEFNSATVEYRKDVIAEMEKNLDAAKAGNKIVTVINLPVPSSYETSYNTAIKMLEMTTETTVDLTMDEFQQYVEDNWHWRASFSASTQMYNAKAAR